MGGRLSLPPHKRSKYPDGVALAGHQKTTAGRTWCGLKSVRRSLPHTVRLKRQCPSVSRKLISIFLSLSSPSKISKSSKGELRSFETNGAGLRSDWRPPVGITILLGSGG